MTDCDPNVTKGKQLVMLVRKADDSAYEIVGGVKERGFNVDNPVEDVTSSSTTGDYAESEYSGYSQMTLNLSGVADRRTGTVDPITGLTIVSAGRLREIATSGNRCGKFKLLNLETNGFIEGSFNVTAYEKTGSTPGLLTFNTTLQSKTSVVIQGDV